MQLFALRMLVHDMKKKHMPCAFVSLASQTPLSTAACESLGQKGGLVGGKKNPLNERLVFKRTTGLSVEIHTNPGAYSRKVQRRKAMEGQMELFKAINRNVYSREGDSPILTLNSNPEIFYLEYLVNYSTGISTYTIDDEPVHPSDIEGLKKSSPPADLPDALGFKYRIARISNITSIQCFSQFYM